MILEKKNVHYISRNTQLAKGINRDCFGIRARLALELAEMDLPVLPGLLFDGNIAGNLKEISFSENLEEYMNKFKAEVGKTYADTDHPLLVKIVVSSNMAIAQYPLLHNIGLARDTVDGFANKVGAEFTSREVLFLMLGALKIEKMIAEKEGKIDRYNTISENVQKLEEIFQNDPCKFTPIEIIRQYENFLPDGFFESAIRQLEVIIARVSHLIQIDEQIENDTSILIQPMVYGNYTKNSSAGKCSTRDVVSGDKKLKGEFWERTFNIIFTPGKDISKLDDKYYKQLVKIASKLEDTFKDVREIRFTIENGKLWIIEQRDIDQKSTASQIKLYFDLLKRKLVTEEELINAFKPEQLSELLHPVIDESSVKNLEKVVGGISGAPGAAVGRVYFSTDDLLEAKKLAKQKNEDTRCILLMCATYAGDVKAIEEATGVLSNEGGYSAHASVVARQYGKISLVAPNMVITGKKAKIGDMVINSGDYITLNVPYYGAPVVYKGEATLVQPNPDKLGLFDIVNVCKKHCEGFYVRANADSPKDAELALKFGAEGIGLCRTEHMFFNEDRINLFRSMILSESAEERVSYLEKLKKFQVKDFYGILKVMAGKQVTIRLLDAPLHEFLPHNSQEMDAFLDFMKGNGVKISKSELQARIDSLSENNPMLGHRGCRIAVSYPEIYEMQVSAIFEAACKLRKEKYKVEPEVMIPLVMNSTELKLILHGKKIEGYTYKGLKEVADEVCEKANVKDMSYKVGTMIELPCAALTAGEIARYAQFFSFGTNDLTQTTLGLSRDDFNSFMPDYTMYDLLEGNPFATLDPRVKELISIATERGKSVRPDLTAGLCGEHGARPENIKFCMNAGINYVSCSAYSVPIALLAIAQIKIAEK